MARIDCCAAARRSALAYSTMETAAPPQKKAKKANQPPKLLDHAKTNQKRYFKDEDLRESNNGTWWLKAKPPDSATTIRLEYKAKDKKSKDKGFEEFNVRDLKSSDGWVGLRVDGLKPVTDDLGGYDFQVFADGESFGECGRSRSRSLKVAGDQGGGQGGLGGQGAVVAQGAPAGGSNNAIQTRAEARRPRFNANVPVAEIADQLKHSLHDVARGEQMSLYNDQKVKEQQNDLQQKETELKKLQAEVKRLKKEHEDSLIKKHQLDLRKKVAEPLPDIYIHQDMKHDGVNMEALLEIAMKRARRGYAGFTVDLKETYKRHGQTLGDDTHTMLVIAWTSIRENAGPLEKRAIDYARRLEDETGCEMDNIASGNQGLGRTGPWFIYFLYTPKVVV